MKKPNLFLIVFAAGIVLAGSVLLPGSNIGVPVAVSFDGVTAGTNSTAAMTVGTGGSLGFSGTGVINATEMGVGSDVSMNRSSAHVWAIGSGTAATITGGILLSAVNTGILSGAGGGSISVFSGFGGSANIAGHDLAGRVTVNNANAPTTGIVQFSEAHAASPVCLAQNVTQGLLVKALITSSPSYRLTLTAITGTWASQDVLAWICVDVQQPF